MDATILKSMQGKLQARHTANSQLLNAMMGAQQPGKSYISMNKAASSTL